MNSVALYGHAFIDEIDGNDYRLGGVMNVARYLRYPYFLNYSLAKAYIIIDKRFQTVDSEVDWRFPMEELVVQAADWHHVAYLNTTLNLTSDFIDSLNGIKSADLCSIKYGIGNARELARCFDYIFMSDCESNSYFRNKQPYNICKTATIIHSAHGIIAYHADGMVIRIPVDRISEPLDTLGAGDALVAHFINNFFDCSTLTETLSRAQSATRESLIQRL
jgi:sugar/nucleoside kinase (ribokinase family)